jgi:hypothetical protein
MEGKDTKPVVPLQTHRIVWSSKGDMVAASETFHCGPPSGEGRCEATSDIVVVDLRTPSRSVKRAGGEVFGFRADGEWLVFRDQERKELEEWSPRTGKIRTSDFAERARGARKICLSPDDTHFVVVEGDGYGTVVRSRDSLDETTIDDLTIARLPPTDCAFSRDGRQFALAGEHHVAMYRLGDSRPASWLPIANVSHLTWSTNRGELTFALRDPETGMSMLFRWTPGPDSIRAEFLGALGALDQRGGIVMRSQCEWDRRLADGRTHVRLGPPATSCAGEEADDILLSPRGRFVAALEGKWGTQAIVTGAAP